MSSQPQFWKPKSSCFNQPDTNQNREKHSQFLSPILCWILGIFSRFGVYWTAFNSKTPSARKLQNFVMRVSGASWPFSKIVGSPEPSGEVNSDPPCKSSKWMPLKYFMSMNKTLIFPAYLDDIVRLSLKDTLVSLWSLCEGVSHTSENCSKACNNILSKYFQDVSHYFWWFCH